MSEYQYYEFLAVDRTLTEKEMSSLRALSTRASITPSSFTNEYNWGNFKGDPTDLMERFFDAHVYVANWGTAIFMVRLPIEALAKETAEALAVRHILDFKAAKTHWIITWGLEESEDYDRFGMEDGHGWMAQLAWRQDRSAPLYGEGTAEECRSVGEVMIVTDVRHLLRQVRNALRNPRWECV